MDQHGPQPADHIAHPWQRFITDTIPAGEIIMYLEHQWKAGYELVSVFDAPPTMERYTTATTGSGQLAQTIVLPVPRCTVVLMWRRDQPIPVTSLPSR